MTRSKKPTFPGCKTGPTGFGHDAIPWMCRGCGRLACATCSHHFGLNRSPVVLSGPQERSFTCQSCAGKR